MSTTNLRYVRATLDACRTKRSLRRSAFPTVCARNSPSPLNGKGDLSITTSSTCSLRRSPASSPPSVNLARRAGREVAKLPEQASLVVAHAVLLQLIDYYGNTPRVSLGTEGYIGLQLALSVVEQAQAESSNVSSER